MRKLGVFKSRYPGRTGRPASIAIAVSLASLRGSGAFAQATTPDFNNPIVGVSDVLGIEITPDHYLRHNSPLPVSARTDRQLQTETDCASSNAANNSDFAATSFKRMTFDVAGRLAKTELV